MQTTQQPTQQPTQQQIKQKDIKAEPVKIVHRTFKKAQLNNYNPNIPKFAGVVKKDNKFYFGDKQIIAEEDIDDFLHKQYTDPKIGLTSKVKFWSYIRTHYAGIPRSYVERYLETNATYQKYRPTKHQASTTKPIIPKAPFNRIQIDLVDFSKLAKYNNDYKWMLTAVDLFTKKAYARALKNKTANEVWQALDKIIEEMPVQPSIVQSDNGGEFKGRVSEGLADKDIKQVFSSPYHPQSQGAVEAFNGTFKKLLARYFDANNTKNWKDAIDDILDNYNNKKHSTTQAEPEKLAKMKLDNKEEYEQLKQAHNNIIAVAHKKSAYASSFKNDLREGDYVRVSLYSTKDLMKNKLSKRNLNPTSRR